MLVLCMTRLMVLALRAIRVGAEREPMLQSHVQVITYFTDVSLKGRLREQQQQQKQQKRRQHQPRRQQQHLMLPAPGAGGNVSDMFEGSDGDDGEGKDSEGSQDSEDDGAPPLQLQLVHMATSNSCDSDSQGGSAGVEAGEHGCPHLYVFWFM